MHFLLLGDFLEYDWIFDIFALIGSVVELFFELLLRGDYSENKCKRTAYF